MVKNIKVISNQMDFQIMMQVKEDRKKVSGVIQLGKPL